MDEHTLRIFNIQGRGYPSDNTTVEFARDRGLAYVVSVRPGPPITPDFGESVASVEQVVDPQEVERAARTVAGLVPAVDVRARRYPGSRRSGCRRTRAAAHPPEGVGGVAENQPSHV